MRGTVIEKVGALEPVVILPWTRIYVPPKAMVVSSHSFLSVPLLTIIFGFPVESIDHRSVNGWIVAFGIVRYISGYFALFLDHYQPQKLRESTEGEWLLVAPTLCEVPIRGEVLPR